MIRLQWNWRRVVSHLPSTRNRALQTIKGFLTIGIIPLANCLFPSGVSGAVLLVWQPSGKWPTSIHQLGFMECGPFFCGDPKGDRLWVPGPSRLQLSVGSTRINILVPPPGPLVFPVMPGFYGFWLRSTCPTPARTRPLDCFSGPNLGLGWCVGALMGNSPGESSKLPSEGTEVSGVFRVRRRCVPPFPHDLALHPLRWDRRG